MPACMFCTREAFDEFGPFDERVDIGEEWPILAGLYHARPAHFVYDQAITALSSGRRMELQLRIHADLRPLRLGGPELPGPRELS